MNTILLFIFQLVILLFSVMIHEISHGLAALKLGDETAKYAGRLTLNPLKHLDPVGSFAIPLLLILSGSGVVIGWAKPVPYNPAMLHKDYKYGPLKVALAGPLSNMAIALVFGIIIRLAGGLLGQTMLSLLGFVVFLNILLAVFNLLPFPPLDGSKILTTFLPKNMSLGLERFGLLGMVFILVFLFFFFPIISGIAFSIFELIVGPSGAGNFVNFF